MRCRSLTNFLRWRECSVQFERRSAVPAKLRCLITNATEPQVKYLNNIVEQDHRAIKRVTRPMLNFKSFRAAGSVLAGIELIHMIRKGQFANDGAHAMSFADQFSTLAGVLRPV